MLCRNKQLSCPGPISSSIGSEALGTLPVILAVCYTSGVALKPTLSPPAPFLWVPSATTIITADSSQLHSQKERLPGFWAFVQILKFPVTPREPTPETEVKGWRRVLGRSEANIFVLNVSVMGTFKHANIMICVTGLWNSLPHKIIEIQNLTGFKTTQTFISVRYMSKTTLFQDIKY